MRLGWWLVVALFAGTVACEESGESVRVYRVLLDGGFELDRHPSAREEIRGSIESFLATDSSLVFGCEPGTETHRLKVRIEAQPQGADKRAETARSVEVVLAPREGPGPTFSAKGLGGDPVALTRSALAGFREAWVRISQQRRVKIDEVSELVALAQAPESHLANFALDRLAAKRVTESVPALSEMLATESEPGKLLRVIGTLAEIGDPRAVPALIELTRRKDDYFVLQVIYAVGMIGGRTAEGFLVTLASGHSSEHVRQVASALLKERQAPGVQGN